MAARARAVAADVRTSDRLDRLVVSPRHAADRITLARTLRAVLPGVPFRQSAEGLCLRPESAPALLGAGRHLDLRWTEAARLFAENRAMARERQPGLVEQIRRLREGGRAGAEPHLAGIGGLEVLDDHQWVNVAAMTLPNGFGLCVFDEQGTGKTVTLIHALDILSTRDQVDFTVIVAPKSMVGEWPRDFERFKGDLYRVHVVTGSRSEKRALLGRPSDIVVTNFETAVAMESELRALVRRHGRRAMLVVDESFFLKNLDARRTRAVRRLREWCGRAFVLCGTPAPNSPIDLVQQFNIVDFGTTFDGVELPEDEDQARETVRSAIEARGMFVRHLKRDVLPHLPQRRFHRLIVPMGEQQQRCYETALEGYVLDLRSVTPEGFQRELPSFLAQRMALLQICSHPRAVTPGYDEVPGKLVALDALLEETVTGLGEKVVLWSYFTATIEAVMARYGEYNPVRYDGTVSEVADRRDAVRRFQEDDATMLFVGNPAAAGAGLTLHRARIAVYESMSNQAAHYLQSLDRVHRRGQTRDVEYLILLCNGSIEMVEYERLLEKERSARDLLGDGVEARITRESLLAEADAAVRLLGTVLPRPGQPSGTR